MSASDASRHHRFRFWLGLAAVILLGVPLLLTAALVIVLNTGSGQRLTERLAARFTANQVQLSGLHGALPGDLKLDHLALQDRAGVWLTADQLRLDWSPLALLTLQARIRTLSATRITLARLPAPAPHPQARGASGGTTLPLHVSLGRLSVDTLALGAPIAGSPAELSLTGAADLRTLTRGTADLAVHRIGAPGDYTLHAVMTDGTIHAALTVREAARGLISMAARLPDLGAIALTAALDGPWRAAATRLSLAAGQLHATAAGTLDLPGGAADLRLAAAAPPMSPQPGLGWRRITLQATLHGKFTAPQAQGTLAIEGLAASGNAIGAIDATIAADRSRAALTLQARDIVLAAPNQDLLGGGPLHLQAGIDLADPAHPVTYRFTQKILTGEGEAILAPHLAARLALTVPDLGAIAATRGKDVQGHAALTLRVSQNERPATPAATPAATLPATLIDLDGRLDVTGGKDAPPGARGATTLGATLSQHGDDLILSRLALDGATAHLHGSGARRNGVLQADWRLDLADLHDLLPALRGHLAITGHLAGPQQNFTAAADLTGALGSAAYKPAPLSLRIAASGLPDRPAGTATLAAEIAGAPADVALSARRGAGQALAIDISRAAWKSLAVSGALALAPGATLPTGRLDASFARLADLAPLTGQRLTGSVKLAVDLPPGGPGHITAAASNAGIAGTATIARLALRADITDPATAPALSARLTADGLATAALAGHLALTADGTPAALALALTAGLRPRAGPGAGGGSGPGTGQDAAIAAAATLDSKTSMLLLRSFTAAYHGERLALAAPARLTYAPGLAVDRLALTIAAGGAPAARLALAGRLSPGLGLTLTGRNLTPALAAPFAPQLDATGALTLDATLGGSLARPTGSVTLAATGLGMRRGPASALPRADLTARARLGGAEAQIEAALDAGATTRLRVQGSVPLAPGGAMDLHAAGAADLALLDPILSAAGRRLRGRLSLDAAATGALAAPRLSGTARLTGGELQDFAAGLHLAALEATVTADGSIVRLTRLTATAGAGSIAATGQLGLTGARPVSLHVTADHARPVDSDLVSATLDADLGIAGALADRVTASGRILVRRADIQLPDKLPPSIAVLDVRRPGAAPPPAAPGLDLPLDITLDAPQQIFVRGRGLDAELGGRLRIGGTAAAPRTSGSIGLRYGSFSLAGTTLNFTSGTISFNGARGIDPELDLVATSYSATITATLTVGGYASAPKITLSSVPDRPQDEILAELLFHQSAASLSPFQLAQIGAALAQISGVGGGGLDPLARLRKGLGLDRLSVGSSGAVNATGGQSNPTTAVEAGRYVAPGVFVGAKQGISGAETQAEVQIDLTKRLKLNTDVGSGAGGNSVGLTYQFQYGK